MNIWLWVLLLLAVDIFLRVRGAKNGRTGQREVEGWKRLQESKEPIKLEENI